MHIATLVASLFLSLALALSAVGKLTENPTIITNMEHVGVPASKVPWLAYIEIVGAAGLIVGLFIWPIGAAAAVGVILYFVGAVASHIRVGDYPGTAPAAFLTTVGVATLVLRILSART